MQEGQLRPAQLFSIWWLRTWRGLSAGMLAVAPFALGFYLLQRAGVSSPWLRWAWQAIIVLAGGATAFWVSRMSLAKRYSDFRIAFFPAHADGPELPLTNRIVAHFWWFLVWRVTLGAAAISIAGEWAQGRLPAQARVLQALAIAAILAWEFLVLRRALTRRYREFRIAIIADSPAAPPQW